MFDTLNKKELINKISKIEHKLDVLSLKIDNNKWCCDCVKREKEIYTELKDYVEYLVNTNKDDITTLKLDLMNSISHIVKCAFNEEVNKTQSCAQNAQLMQYEDDIKQIKQKLDEYINDVSNIINVLQLDTNSL